MLTPMEAAMRILTKEQFQPLTFQRKLGLFFVDPDILPLYVHDNYLTAYGTTAGPDDVETMCESSEFISVGDCINTVLRHENDWTLLPNVGICACVAPGILSGKFLPLARFPHFLVCNMEAKKTRRLLGELVVNLAGKVNGSRGDLLNECLPYLVREIVKNVSKGGKENLLKATKVLEYYNLSVDHFKEHMLELSFKNKYAEEYKNLTVAQKAAFVRFYNKTHADEIDKAKGKKTKVSEEEEEAEEGITISDREEEMAENLEDEIVILFFKCKMSKKITKLQLEAAGKEVPASNNKKQAAGKGAKPAVGKNVPKKKDKEEQIVAVRFQLKKYNSQAPSNISRERRAELIWGKGKRAPEPKKRGKKQKVLLIQEEDIFCVSIQGYSSLQLLGQKQVN
eukprot:TRINITY_DN9704_c0_g1_i1.p2 TRINITY_DN9704_c0_g1~~TRINITY_DN9704_c0_g1_i1.p2  ORF type:complete len:396 (+),score=48.87 TRINITY_DN9704_c0_g1_i1:2431-3618(+)